MQFSSNGTSMVQACVPHNVTPQKRRYDEDQLMSHKSETTQKHNDLTNTITMPPEVWVAPCACLFRGHNQSNLIDSIN